MISNKVRERLLKKNWYVECKTEQEANLLLRACDESGITWCTGCKATERKSYKRYPVEIGFCNEGKGLTHSTTEDFKDSECENITDWFFNAIKNNDDNGKLTPQNAEEEHYMQILLAKMRRIPVECDFGYGDGWVDSTILYIDLGKKYRIKPTSTPLPISREIWSHLNKRWKCATMDRDGRTFWHQEKPTKNHLGWDSVDSRSTYPLNFNSEGINWETSLTERPEDV